MSTNTKLEQKAREGAVHLLHKIKMFPKEQISDYPYLVGLKMELMDLDKDQMENLINFVTVEFKQPMEEFAGNCRKILVEYEELEGNPISQLHLKFRIKKTIDILEDVLKEFDNKKDLIESLEDKENKTPEEITILETLKKEDNELDSVQE